MVTAPPPFDRFAQFRRYLGVGFHPGGDLCYTSDVTGQFNLWRQPLGPDGAPGYPRLLTGYSDRVVRDFVFADDGRSVFYQADPNGDENYQLYRLWLDQGSTETLTDAPKVQHELGGGTVALSGHELLYTDNARKATDVDVVVRDLRTGAVSRPFPRGTVWGNPRFDPARARILAVRFNSSSDVHTFVLQRRTRELTEVLPHKDDGEVWPIDFTADGQAVLALSDVGSDYRRLILYPLSKGKTRILAAPRADIEYAAYARRARTLAYVSNTEGYSTIFVGPTTGPFSKCSVPRGAIPFGIWGRQFEIDEAGRSLVALWGTGAAPPELLWIPLGGPRQSRYVTDGMVGGVPDRPLRPPLLVKVPAPDGRTIPAFLYRPKRPPRGRMPAVLAIHGGPHAQDRPDWRSGGLYQFLNSRGITVLDPNYRGSSGYGKAYREVLHRDWGGVDLEDYRACAEWLRRQPNIDPRRLAVYGGSFGGFAVLSCLTRLPQYWRAGVDVFGPSNLVTFLESVPPSWRRGMVRMLGDPKKDRAFLLSRSPITHLDHLRADLLVIQGGQDPRVVQHESDQLVARLRKRGRRVEYTVFPDEGHGFTRPANQLKAMGEVANFLLDHLRPAG